MKDIAIVQTAFLGDLLLTIPLLKRLRAFEPGANLHLIGRKGLRELFLSLGLVDFYYEVDKTKKFFKSAHQLPPCDLVLSPHKSVTSARQVLKIRSPLKVGYKNFWNSFVFDRRIDWPRQLPEALRTLSLLAVLDEELKGLIEEYEQKSYSADTLRPVPTWASMAIGDEALTRLQSYRLEKWDSLKPTVVLAPGSVWATKRWTLDGYLELSRRLLKGGYQVAITGSPAEAAIGREIGSQAPVVDFCGKLTLLETLWLMSVSRAVVSNDSGAMHMASAVSAPTVAIFGPTVLRFGYQPWQNRARVVERTDLDCRPCSPHGTQECPLGHHHCMKWISAGEVESALLELMDS